MPMEIDRKQLKTRAKESMSLSNPSIWLVTLVYLLMTTGVSSVADFAPGVLAGFLSIALTLYTWVVGFSYRLWALWTARRLEPGLGSLMDGFSVAGRVILLELGILVRTFGWTLLFSLVTGMLVAATDNIALMLLLLAVTVVAVNIVTLRYSMAYYVLADYPDLGPSVALAHSVRLTKGWVMELFKLHLSFAGWYVLSFVLAVAGLGLGLSLGGGLPALAALPFDQILTQIGVLEISPAAAILAHVLSLPVTLYFTPYLEVTLAEFYTARIALPDNMADPMAGMQMPPL